MGSWGDDLWDQYDAISAHTQDGLDFAEKIGNFARARAKIEIEYGNALRKLTKQYQAEKVYKRKNPDDEMPTTVKAWQTLLAETDDVAKQHESIGETLAAQLVESFKTLIKDKTADRKKILAEGAKLQANLKRQMEDLEKVKQKYEKCCKEAEVAHQTFAKADKELNIKKSDVDKLKNAAQQKKQLAEEANNDYILCVEKTNSIRQSYYNTELPQVLNALQQMDEDRTSQISQLFVSYSEIERGTLSIITSCLNNIREGAEKIDPHGDSALFIEDHKSGFMPPGDVQYQEYGKPQLAVAQSQMRRVGSGQQNKPKAGIFGFGKKKEEERDDFGNLPPEKRKKKIKEKIGELQADIDKEKKGRSGMDHMMEVYTTNPKLADEKAMLDLRAQLGDSDKKLEKLNFDLYKYQCYLEALDSTTGTSASAAPGSPQASRPASSNLLDAAAADQAIAQSVEYTSAAAPQAEEQASLGECRVLYDFSSANEGEMTVYAGEVLAVVERDGSGWVRTMRGEETGYVPETYIEFV
eukprot:Opistho-2@80013